MLPQPCLSIVRSVERARNLLNSIVIIPLCTLLSLHLLSSRHIVWQSHENTVKPHLICVYCLVPPHTLLRARLLLKLAKEGFQRNLIPIARHHLIHP